MSPETFVRMVAMFGLLVVWPFMLATLVRRMLGPACEGHGHCEACGARAWQCDCGGMP